MLNNMLWNYKASNPRKRAMASCQAALARGSKCRLGTEAAMA
jgi:hypothetical protein